MGSWRKRYRWDRAAILAALTGATVASAWSGHYVVAAAIPIVVLIGSPFVLSGDDSEAERAADDRALWRGLRDRKEPC